MKLIIGLGNPGAEYVGTRHNLGWAAVDNLAKQYGAKWNKKSKFSAEIAEITVEDEKVLLAKPQTFYNLSGETAQKIKQFYNLDNSDILVIHDEMDLPVGLVRVRRGGMAAGNNGIESLITQLGPDFARIRIGSGLSSPVHDGLAKPSANQRDHVLSRPSTDEADILKNFAPVIAQVAADFIKGNLRETTYSQFTHSDNLSIAG